MATIQKITPCLWFDTEAEDAANYYTGIFKNSSVGKIGYYNKEGFEQHRRPAGSVVTVEFTIEGQSFIALNGGPQFKFSEAVSFTVYCDTQEEIDYYWNKLTAEGEESVCGWLKDKYGLSWQIIPTMMRDFFLDADSEKSERAMKALMQMKRLDIKKLKDAYDGHEK